MPDEKSGNNTPIIVAIISLIGVLVTVLVPVFKDKIVAKPSPPAASTMITTGSPVTPTQAKSTDPVITALYYDHETGLYSYCHGNVNAESLAYNRCLTLGGKKPYLVFKSQCHGFGVVCEGKAPNGHYEVSISAGWASLDEAKTIASTIFKNRYGTAPFIYRATWNDN